MNKAVMEFIRFVYRRVNLKLAIRGPIEFSRDLRVGCGTTIKAPTHMKIGAGVSIGAYTSIACDGRIGDGVLISSNVGIVGRYDHDHKEIGNYISQSRWIYDPSEKVKDRRNEIIIEDDVWIGFGAVILSGITISRGAVVAAGSVVIHDVEPYSIVAGSPARKISERFNELQRTAHESALSEKRLSRVS
jgi:acetyltransferase-like isoleucine patch superfamily enzyme